MNNLGFLMAVAAALCWGSYLVPFKKSRSQNLVLFQAIMALGILLSGLVVSLLFQFALTLNIWGLLSGVLWAIPNALSLIAVANLGIARATPIISSLVILVSFSWGALVFGEMSKGLSLGFLAIGFIILGVVMVASSSKTENQNIKRGLLTAMLSGLIWGSQFVPIKIGQVSPKDYFFSMTVGIFATAMVISFINRIKFQKRGISASLLSGVIWAIGNLLAVFSIAAIGLAKGLPVTQLAVLVAVLWGLFYFKEVVNTRARVQVLIGAMILLGGVAVLSFA